MDQSEPEEETMLLRAFSQSDTHELKVGQAQRQWEKGRGRADSVHKIIPDVNVPNAPQRSRKWSSEFESNPSWATLKTNQFMLPTQTKEQFTFGNPAFVLIKSAERHLDNTKLYLLEPFSAGVCSLFTREMIHVLTKVWLLATFYTYYKRRRSSLKADLLILTWIK